MFPSYLKYGTSQESNVSSFEFFTTVSTVQTKVINSVLFLPQVEIHSWNGRWMTSNTRIPERKKKMMMIEIYQIPISIALLRFRGIDWWFKITDRLTSAMVNGKPVAGSVECDQKCRKWRPLNSFDEFLATDLNITHNDWMNKNNEILTSSNDCFETPTKSNTE